MLTSKGLCPKIDFLEDDKELMSDLDELRKACMCDSKADAECVIEKVK